MKEPLFNFDAVMSPERAKQQFSHVIQLLKSTADEAMKTPEGREALRRDIAAMQGIAPSEVKFEGEP